MDVRESMMRIILMLPLLALVILLAGCSATGSKNNASSNQLAKIVSKDSSLKIVNELPLPDNSSGFDKVKISTNDLLEIKIFQVPDLNRTVRVEPNGNISLRGEFIFFPKFFNIFTKHTVFGQYNYFCTYMWSW